MEILKVTISHPEKMMFPEIMATKETIANYYAFIAPFMLPHIKDRPLSLQQFPEGVAHHGFFHKHSANFYPDYLPDYVVATHKNGGTMHMVGAKTARDLVYLANQNAIEFHIPTATMKHITKPDQIILDFDPSDDDFSKVRTLALSARNALKEKGFESFVKTTGNRGLHVHIPCKAKLTFEDVKPISKEIAEYLCQQNPEIATTQLRKNKRENKVFIDYLRNDAAMTAIAPYSLRPNSVAGIATPIHWEELDNKSLHAQSFTIKNIYKRMQDLNDPWADFK